MLFPALVMILLSAKVINFRGAKYVAMSKAFRADD